VLIRNSRLTNCARFRCVGQHCESASPRIVPPRALWLIGTSEEDAFNAFALLLDLASSIGSELMIRPYQDFKDRTIPEWPLFGDVRIGNLVYLLEEVDLFADALTTRRQFRQGTQFLTTYGTKRFLIECSGAHLLISGVIPTRLGQLLASFYQRRINPLGEEIFAAWIASLDKDKFPVKPVD
jgi:hypothetical protein